MIKKSAALIALGCLIVLIGWSLYSIFIVKSDLPQQELPHTDKTPALEFAPYTITLNSGKTFNLNAPTNVKISVVKEGLNRARFMALSPDNRLFVTDMHDLSDNSLGKIYIFGVFNRETRKFESSATYLNNLRNPNSVAFYTDHSGARWLYIALTDKLVRYPYMSGDTAPHDAPQVLATFPAYGLSYKYGGWHLTRTVAIHNDKVYVSVGSSCNSCEEKESVRASIVEMDPDGSNQKPYAIGLRNAVGIKWVGNDLFATDMGVDHLGNDKPNDMFYKIKEGTNYGWPYCYAWNGSVYPDDSIDWKNKSIDCASVPPPDANFEGHAAPLGLDYFNSSFTDAAIKNSFLVALHGASTIGVGSGSKIVQVKGGQVSDYITGFLADGKRLGRPADIMRYDDSSFFFTDDFNGILYFVETK
jgi:glucose/arabinose dehydrogenase